MLRPPQSHALAIVRPASQLRARASTGVVLHSAKLSAAHSVVQSAAKSAKQRTVQNGERSAEHTL